MDTTTSLDEHLGATFVRRLDDDLDGRVVLPVDADWDSARSP
jgi:hypothetical protein